MKNVIFSFLFLCFCFSYSNINAQEWSKNQTEVWTAVEDWWVQSKAHNTAQLIAMIHDDYKGWGFDSRFPTGKAELLHWVNNGLLKRKVMYTSLKPLEIMVSGDVAVIHYFYAESRMVDGKTKGVEGRWTDIWKKDGNKWKLYADSGGEFPSKK